MKTKILNNVNVPCAIQVRLNKEQRKSPVLFVGAVSRRKIDTERGRMNKIVQFSRIVATLPKGKKWIMHISGFLSEKVTPTALTKRITEYYLYYCCELHCK